MKIFFLEVLYAGASDGSQRVNIPPAKKTLSRIQIFHKYFILSKKTVILRYFSKDNCIFIENLSIIINLSDDNLYLYSKIHQINNTKQRNTLNTSINKVEMIKLLI